MLNVESLEQRISEGMAAARVPGASLCVIHEREVVYSNGFGTTSVEDGGLPVTPTTLFRIGSTTKPMTATAILRLVEEDKLDLDRTVRSYLPWFALKDSDVAAVVTVRHLMTHTSGLDVAADHWGSRDPSGLERYVRDDLPGYDLIAKPGEVFQYSNPAVDVAGYLAEVVAEKPFTELMQELVFDPLEMTRTTFDPLVAMTYPLAQSHDLDAEGHLRVQHRYADHVGNYPAGFVMAPVVDVANFALMLLGGGSFNGTQVLQPETIAAMSTPHIRTMMAPRHSYGLMLMVADYRGHQRVGHPGGISTFTCQFELLPASGSAVILQCNRAGTEFDTTAFVDSIFNELLDLPAEEPPPTRTVDRGRWRRYVGRYVSPLAGVAEVTVAGDELTLNYNGRDAGALRCVEDDLYQAEVGPAKVTIGFRVPIDDDAGQGPVEWAAIMGMPARRTEDTAASLGAADLRTFAGTYTGKLGGQELILEVTADDGKLTAKMVSPPQPEAAELMPLGGRRFASPSGVLEFAEGEPSGRITVAGQLVLQRT